MRCWCRFIPDQGEGKQVRWYALVVTLITFLITVAAYLTGYDPSSAVCSCRNG